MYDKTRKLIIGIVCHFLFRVKYENIEVLEKFNKCLICPNHSRIFDPIFLFPKVDNMYSMAKSELFEHKVLGDFLEYHHVFPIDRERVDVSGVKKAIRLLKNNDKIKLLIFPEGRVLKDKKERGQIKNGAMYIASMLEIPIIPVYITARPKYFSRVIVKFGEPIFTSKQNLKDKEKIKSESIKLMEKIYNLENWK